MIFNRMQGLRNGKIKIAREVENTYFYIQGPTIGELYEDEKLFLVSQILLMTTEELKEFLKIESDFSKLEMITMVVTKFEDGSALIDKFKKIILNFNIKNQLIYIDKDRIQEPELEKISDVLEILMGQKNQSDFKKLSPDEQRLEDFEKKLKEKKLAQANNDDKNVNDSSTVMIENIIIAVIYEFGFDFEKIMNMNHFTLIWYYSFTSKLHVYRINQHAIASGMVKKINTDYFTGLK